MRHLGSTINPYGTPTYFSRDFRPIHMYAGPAYGGTGKTVAVSGSLLAAVIAAGVISWKRNDDLSGGVRFLKAWGSSIIWPAYLIYVGIDKMTGD